MSADDKTLEKIDGLYDMGRDFVEHPEIHGATIEYQFDECKFDQWRRKVNDLLFSLGGCEDLYYQRFSKDVTRPDMKDLEEGLRILAAARDDIACDAQSRGQSGSGIRGRCGRSSVSYR